MPKPNENQVSSGYPKAIIHVDGDAFFASCEVAKDPKLRGLPVVVGGMRGIALAITYEAKALGVTRGMPIYQLKKMYPSVVVLPGDYELYEQFARRMYAIVRRYTPQVEEYSVDECFADITDMRRVLKMEYEEIAARIKFDLETELGVSFSVGLAPTKVLAKVASKYQKPSGLVCITRGGEREYLANVAVGKLWGVGPATAQLLYRHKVKTALQFADLPSWWVKENMAKPHRALWTELHGVAVYDVDPESHAEQKSIQSTRTFRPPSKDKSTVFSQLSKNVEEACRHARSRGLTARHIYCFLKSQDFQYLRFEVTLLAPTNVPSVVLGAVAPLFEKNFRSKIVYRATGVTLADVQGTDAEQKDLFGASMQSDKAKRLYEALDSLEGKYGKGAVHLASSMSALKGHTPTGHPPLALPYLGEVG